MKYAQFYCFSWYNQSIHSAHKGEWDFDVQKKSVVITRFHGPSCKAICSAQEDLARRGSCIKRPLLLLCSNRYIKSDKTWRDEYSEGKAIVISETRGILENVLLSVDIVLNVAAMRRVVSAMSPQVTIYEVENAKHDVFLSKLETREKAFKLMFQWLKNLEDSWLT